MSDANGDENIGSFYMGRQRAAGPRRKLPPGLLTVLILAFFGGLVWYVYPRGAEKYTDIDVPLVKADTAPIKAAPQNPGGMEVPHQDSTVFDPVAGKNPDAVEKIMPAPEQPVNKAQAIQQAEQTPAPAVAAKMAPADMKMDLQAKDSQTAALAKDVAPEPAAVPPKPAQATPKTGKAAPAKPAVKSPAASQAAEKQYYIQLGSFRDEAAAGTSWKRLKKKYPGELGKLSMRTTKVTLPGKGVYYRLQAGKLGKDAAHKVCAAIKGGCILVRP